MLRTAAVATSVVLFVLAYPPLDLRAAAWIALVPLLLAARSVSTRAAFALGAAWNLAAAFCLIDALPHAARRVDRAGTTRAATP